MLLYLGYGVMGGVGVGLGYTPVIQLITEWFPDNIGIATSIAIGGYGSGAFFFAPLAQNIMDAFQIIPLWYDIYSDNIINKFGITYIQ
jgi:hypothetical protein